MARYEIPEEYRKNLQINLSGNKPVLQKDPAFLPYKNTAPAVAAKSPAPTMADFKKYDYAQSKDILPRKQSTIQWGGKTDDLTNLPFKNTRAADDYLVNQGFMRQEANRPVLSAPSGNSVLPIKKPTALERADSFIKSTGSGAMNAVSGIFDYMGNLPVKTAQERVSARDDYFRMWEQAKANPALLRDKEFQSRLLQAQLTASSGYNWMDDTLTQFDPTASSTASQMLQEQQAKSAQKLKEGMSPAASAVTDVALAGTDMALKFGLSSAMGVPFLAFMGADSGAQAGQNALNEGYSASQSATMSAGAGAITAGVESFGGIAGKWGDKLIGALVKSPAGKAIAGKLPANVMEYISKLSASKVGQIAGDALSEGAEEFTEYGAQLFLENLVLDKDTPYDIKQALYNAGIGGAVGGLFGGGRVFAQDILPRAKADMPQHTVSQGQSQAKVPDELLDRPAWKVDRKNADKVPITDPINLKRYRSEIDESFTGVLPSGSDIIIGKTPDVLIKYGAPEAGLHMSQSTARKIAYPSGYLGLQHGHNLGLSTLKNLPYQLENPIAILKNPQPNSMGLDSLVVITEWYDDAGNRIVTPIHLNKQGAIELQNDIASTFGANYIKTLLGDNNKNVLYTKNNEDIDQLLSTGVNYPKAMADDIFAKNIISDDTAKSNPPLALPIKESKNSPLPEAQRPVVLNDSVLPYKEKPKVEEPTLNGYGKNTVGAAESGGRVLAQDILPRADARNSANASSDIASEMKPEYNQGGGDMNANDTGRAAGSQIQNDRGLHGREDGSGAFGEEISGIQENQRTNAEPAGTFIARATQEGKVVEADDFGNIVSYKPAQMVTGNAAEAQEILKRRGLDCFVYEGTLARNKNGMTVEHLTDAQTLADGRIGIKGDCTLPGVEIAGHEGFHSITITNPEIAETFLQNISLAPAGKSIAYQETYDAVGLAMYGDKYSPTNSTQRNNILKELGAQIGGKMDSDLELARELFSDMLDDFDATYELWKKVNADFDALKSGRSGAASGYGQNTVGAAESGGRMTNAQLVEEYGALRKGEQPRAREIDLAAQTREGKTSRFAQNAAESAALGDTQAEAIEQEVASGTFAYIPIADQSAVDTANGRISQYGYEQTLNDFDSLLRSDKRIGKNDIALGELLIQEAAKRGDTDTVVKLVADVAALGTEMGQNVQALRILKRLSPEGRLMASQRMVQRINEQHRGKKGWKDVTIPKENVQDLLSQTTPDGMDAANDRILQAVADQMPSSWVDKWNAWRYLAMLGNVRTQGRNLWGNTVFVPARKFKNLIAAGLESTLPMKERSKAILNRRAAGDRALIEFAKGDYANVRDAILGTGKMNATSQLDQKRTIFKNNGDWGTRADDGILPRKVRAATDKLWSGVEGYRKLTDWAMDQGDAIFAKSAYAESLASYMKANGLKPADMVNQFGGETQAAVQARNYAVLEAQKATYRDASKVATALSKFSRTNKATALFTEGILPFKKTPMNVLKRGYEYSPVSFLTTFTKGAYDLKTGKITATEWIDRLASGLSGTGILALGWALTKLGVLTGGALEDKKEQELNELQGVQNYSVVLPGGIYYDVSWMAPVSIPLFIGSEIANMQEREGREIGITEFMDAANKLAEPMLEMSMLDGLQSTIQAAGYSGNALGAMTGNAVGSYFGQAIPTIFGQAARTIDPVRRGVYVDKNEDMPAAFQRFFQSNIKAKLPFANQSLQPRLDAWGRESAPKSLPLRAFENFVSPGYISMGQTTPADKAVTDLYAATGENSILPSKVSKYVTVDGEKINYTGDQYTQIQRKRGQSANELIAKLAGLPVYQELDNAGKVDAMEDIYKYTRQMAIADVIPEYKPDTWVTDAYEAEKSGLELASYLAWRASYGELKPDKDRNGKTTYSASDKFRDLLNMDRSLTAAQKARLEQDFTGADNPRDYSSGNAFVLSGLTDSQQEKYSGRLAKTLTPQEYAKALKAMGGSVRDKKTGKVRQKNRQEKIDSLVAAGYSRQRAAQIYNLVK